jgi:hypothetical protein
MTKIAFQVLRLGTRLQVVAFNKDSGDALLKRSYPFGGAGIKDDGQSEVPPNRRSTTQIDTPHGTWKTTKKGLTKGGFKLAIDFNHNQITLTPVSPRSKEPISEKEIRYNFRHFGTKDGRETKIQQAKNTISYRVRRERKKISDKKYTSN